MSKTIVVQSITRVPHAKFGKIVKQKKKFYAHDEENKAKTGDTVWDVDAIPADIAKRAGVPAEDILELNGLSRPEDVRPGRLIFVLTAPTAELAPPASGGVAVSPICLASK